MADMSDVKQALAKEAAELILSYTAKLAHEGHIDVKNASSFAMEAVDIATTIVIATITTVEKHDYVVDAHAHFVKTMLRNNPDNDMGKPMLPPSAKVH